MYKKYLYLGDIKAFKILKSVANIKVDTERLKILY